MALVSVTFVCTGANTGMTGLLGKRWKVRDGRFTVEADEALMAKKTRFFGRFHAAFPEGSAELAHALEVDRGNSALQALLKSRGTAAVPAGSQPVVERSAEVPADDGSAADAGGKPAPEHGSGGDGHADSGMDRPHKFQEAVRAAVAKLDPSNDDHWTVEGLPRVDVVAGLMNKPDLTRRDLNEYASGMVRPQG
jgi:hypothetical protein